MIGITGRRTLRQDEFPDAMRSLRSDLYITDYTRAVAVAGGTPVLISRESDPVELANQLDGFVLSGGEDVDPRRYGAVPGPRSSMLDPGRDEFELALVSAVLAARRPLLGICRGMQVINVALRGTLTADLPIGSGESHAFFGYPVTHRAHAVEVRSDTHLHQAVGPRVLVNSYHHQALDRLGDGLLVTGEAADGVIEAVELPGRALLAVQWHPELLDETDPVFHWLIEQCTTAHTEVEEHRAHT